MSLIVPRDVQFTLRFAVGQRFCVATLRLERDEDAADVLRKFFTQENIPVYLHDSIYSTVRELIWEEANCTIRESENILDTALMVESARLLARQYDATVKKRQGSNTLDANHVFGANSTDPVEKMAAAYSALVTSSEWSSTLSQLESSYAMAISQLIDQRETALTGLRERQSKEMERYSQQGAHDQISQLVNRHVQEIDKLEKVWETEISEAKARQKSEYRQFILESYKAFQQSPQASRLNLPEPPIVNDKPSPTSQSTPKRSDRSSWAPWNALFGGSDSNKDKDAERANNSASTINAPFGRDGQPIPNGLNNRSGRLQPQIDSASHNSDNFVSIIAMLGGIQKVPYEIQVTCAQNAFAFASSTKSTREGRSNPFGTNLSAAVLITDTNVSLHSSAYSEFIRLCDKSTEFLFDDVHAQLARIRAEMALTASAPSTPTSPEMDTLPDDNPSFRISPAIQSGTGSSAAPQSQAGSALLLKTGDFFITTHSNLSNIDVVFHMALEKKNNAASTSKMLSGLRNILALASQYDITVLTLPALLLEPEFKHLFSEAQLAKRAEQIVREIRAFLVENSHGDNSLRTIRLVLNSGPSAADMYQSLVKVVHNTFNQSL